LWGFSPTRKFKRSVGAEYPKRWKQYILVDPYKKITSVFRSRLYNIERTEDNVQNLKTYNEFEF
jgi:hypothetical protein